MNETVSVIITTYKRKMEILSRAIRTVKAQTYQEIELIVVNDYPSYKDRIIEVLKDYPDVKLISHEKNQGACASRNDGIAAATGKYIALLDDDDEWETNKIETQLTYLIEKNADMVYCTGRYCCPDGSEFGMDFIHDVDEDPLKDLLMGNCMGGCSFPLMKKDILLSVGGFDVQMPSSQDYDLWIRIAKTGKVVFLNEPLVKYNLQNDSISSDATKRISGYYKLLAKHRTLFRQYPGTAGNIYRNILDVALSYRDYEESLKAMLMSFECFPENIAVFKLLIEKVSNKVKK